MPRHNCSLGYTSVRGTAAPGIKCPRGGGGGGGGGYFRVRATMPMPPT